MIKTKAIAIFVILSILISTSGCKIFEVSGETKKKEEEVKVNCYAADFKTTTDVFRATSSGYDNDEMLAADKALLNSKSAVVTTIRSVVTAAVSKFIDQSEAGKKTNFKEIYLPKINEKVKEVLNSELSDYTVICQQTSKLESGLYQSDISVEVNKRTIVDGINTKLSSSSFSNLYDAIKFEQLFNEELKILIDRERSAEENR